METIVLLTALIALGGIIYTQMGELSYRNFQKKMKPGDDCFFYKSGNKCYGTVNCVMKKWVGVQTIYGHHTILKVDLYPNSKYLLK